MSATEVLVTGGTGTLGREVVRRLEAAGVEARVLSRSGRSGTIRGDLLTGEGLERTVEGVDTVVHCASSPLRKTRQADVDGTELLLGMAERAGVSHVVFISIVGVDLNPHFPYYRTKLDAERVIERSPVPWTILRATQFHEFVLRFVRLLGRGPVALAPGGFLLQPIDVREVAARMAELAFSGAVGRVPDIGGPEVRTFAELARTYFETTGRNRRIIEVPVPGKVGQAFREGAQICPDHRYGEITWGEFLRQTIGRARS